MQSLRERLRRDTAQHHRVLDEAFSRLDVARGHDLELFVRANLSAIAAIRCGEGARTHAAERLREDLRAALVADLRHLGGRAPARLKPHPVDPLSVRYVLLGSRAGTGLLRRRWRQTSEPRVAGAAAYFDLAPAGPNWRDLREELSSMSAGGAAADRVVRDASAIFDIYLSACIANQPITGALNA